MITETNHHQAESEELDSIPSRPATVNDGKKEEIGQNWPESNPGHPFWKRVQIGKEDECWPWLGSLDRDGYGRYCVGPNRYRANRFALLLTHGSAVADLHALHKCDNRRCCNPNHLKPGTHQQNMADRNAKGRQAAGERNGRAKLTTDTVRAIRAAYVPYKVSVAKLSAQFGVNAYVVADVINRVTWKGVEPDPTPDPLTEGRSV